MTDFFIGLALGNAIGLVSYWALCRWLVSRNPVDGLPDGEP